MSASRSLLLTGLASLLFSGLVYAQESNSLTIETEPFGKTEQNEEVTRYTLTNASGNQVSVMNWGATLLEVIVADGQGKRENVNLAFATLEPYLVGHPMLGSTVGRFCNRIGGAQFSIDGVVYEVTKNAGKHHIHGGKRNFTYQFWEAESYRGDDSIGVRFRLVSPDGQEGFPGTVSVITDYNWNNLNELTITFTATTDAPTHVNLTNHSYWNLGGVGSGTVLDHLATIEADDVLDADADKVPTGKINSVAGTALDFRQPTSFGERIDQVASFGGYDHCFVVRGKPGVLRPAARIVDPKSKRVLEIETTQPGMQLYTANFLPGNERSAGAGRHEAFCLETQHYPDSPNHAHFPSTLLRPGETMRQVTVHRFSTLEQ